MNFIRGLSPKGDEKGAWGKYIYLARPVKQAHHLQDFAGKVSMYEKSQKSSSYPRKLPDGRVMLSELEERTLSPLIWRMLFPLLLQPPPLHPCLLYLQHEPVSRA